MLKLLGRALLTMLAFVAYSFAQSLALVPTLMTKGQASAVEVAGVFVVVFGALLWGLWRLYQRFLAKEPQGKQWGLKRLDRQTLGFTVLMTVLLMLIQIGGGYLQLRHITAEPANQSALLQLMQQAPLAMVLIACVGGPAAEELIFRGLLMHCFPHQDQTRWRALSGLVSAVIFGLAHSGFSDPLNWLIYAGLGAVFAATYAHTKDLRYSLVLHFLNNLAALL